MFIALI